MKLVRKFGGRWVGSAERILQAAEIVRSEVNKGHQVVVVLSAMSGVTNTLLGALKDAADGNMGRLLQTRGDLLKRHLDVINALVKNQTAREQLTATTTSA